MTHETFQVTVWGLEVTYRSRGMATLIPLDLVEET